MIPVLAGVAGLLVGWLLGRRARSGTRAGPAMERVVSGKPQLRAVSGGNPGQVVAVDADPVVVGRDPDECALWIADETGSVSRRHCTVSWDAIEGAFVVIDDGSKNGTVVEGRVVCTPGEPVRLIAGGTVMLGSSNVRLETSLVPEPPSV